MSDTLLLMTDRISDKVSHATNQSSRSLSDFDSSIKSIVSGVNDYGVSSALNCYLNDSNDCKYELDYMKRNLCDKMTDIERIEKHYLNELSDYMGHFDSSWMRMIKDFGSNISDFMEDIAKSSWLAQVINKMNLGEYSDLFKDDVKEDWFSHALDNVKSQEEFSRLLIEYDEYKQMPLWAKQEMNSYKTSWYLADSDEDRVLFHGYANNLRGRLKVYNQMTIDDKMRVDKLYETPEMTIKEQMRIDEIFNKYTVASKVDISELIDGVQGDSNTIKTQAYLYMMGFDIGNSGINDNGIDSQKGKLTTYGIRKYQRWAGLEVNGEINESLMQHMENSINDGVSISEIYNEMQVFDAPNSNFRVTSYFGPRKAPVDGASTYHNGIDLGAVKAGVAGDDVLSTIKGIVTDIDSTKARGNYITVSADYGNDKYEIRVQHLMDDSTKVVVGEEVDADTVLARMGNTGVGSAVHLHYEIKLNGNYVDPLDYLKYPGER